jgi:hypothetical protein
MSRKVRSAKGEVVDFDLLKIKEQMASAPPPTDVRARQDFIDKRLRRRLKKTAPPAPKIAPTEKTAVDPKLPGTEELTEEPKMIDEVKDATPRTRQKARPPKKPE